MYKIIGLLLGFGLVIPLLMAQQAAPTKHLNLADGLALEGYDAVAYFTQGKAVKGLAKYAVTHNGATYYFSSQANKQVFNAAPQQYQPQYGGWCAYAMGENGEKVSINPETFKIIDGKLYLFYNAYFTNTLKSWNQDQANLKRKADANWFKLLQH